jgi:catechol 2,3-dioxygenase-like lactoylglutathione lyase family enzyme
MIAGARLDHTAIAVERIAGALPRYAGDLSGRWHAGGPSAGFIGVQLAYRDGMRLEILEPNVVEQNDFLRRFLDRNGPGPHHLTFKVPDIQSALAGAEEAGYRPVNVDLSDPRWKEAFLHPKDAPGVVVQLAQAAGEWESDFTCELPAPRSGEAAVFLHTAHAVARLDEGLRLFASLLSGEETGRGEEGYGRYVDLAWPGDGRLRLLELPGGAEDPWLQGRPGRVHHLAFAVDRAAEIAGPAPLDDGRSEIPADRNAGVRLVLTRSQGKRSRAVSSPDEGVHTRHAEHR